MRISKKSLENEQTCRTCVEEEEEEEKKLRIAAFGVNEGKGF